MRRHLDRFVRSAPRPRTSRLSAVNPLHTRRGFTLLEVMVVLVVSGVVVALSSGKIHDILVQQRVARAATALQNEIEAAFTIAGRNRQPVRITWDSAGQRMLISDRTATTYYRKTTLSQDAYGLSPSSFSSTRSSVDIYPNGLANDSLVITISSSPATKKVRMLRGGVVQVQ